MTVSDKLTKRQTMTMSNLQKDSQQDRQRGNYRFEPVVNLFPNILKMYRFVLRLWLGAIILQHYRVMDAKRCLAKILISSVIESEVILYHMKKPNSARQ